VTARRSAAVAFAACCLALPAARAAGQTATTGTPQSLFTSLIAKDRRTAPDIRAALRSGRVFVDEDVTFAELTGDGRQDAIVRVDSGGAGGTIAVYVFSTDGAKRLRAVYRNQRLYRALAGIDGTAVLVSTPRYQAGDELCCASQMLERRLTWSGRARRMVLRSTRAIPAPV